jgi:hypothetical protein
MGSCGVHNSALRSVTGFIVSNNNVFAPDTPGCYTLRNLTIEMLWLHKLDSYRARKALHFSVADTS